MEHQRNLYLTDFSHGLNDADMAAALLLVNGQPEPANPRTAEYKAWAILKDKVRRALHDAHRAQKRAYAFGSEDIGTTEKGKAVREWRWHDATQVTAVPAVLTKIEQTDLEQFESAMFGAAPI